MTAAPTTTTTIETAKDLLKSSSWFSDASDSLIEALAVKMVPIEAHDGHVFLEEGEEVHQLLVIEEGTLVRTKLAVKEEDRTDVQRSLREMTSALRASTLTVNAVVVDELSGYGYISGMLHNMKDGSKAFATVSAKGPVKVWVIPGEDFREAISSVPEHSLEVMNAMANAIRDGERSLRGLIKRVKARSDDEQNGGTSNTCRVLCYDATSWTVDGFKEQLEDFNKSHSDHGCVIEMDFTTERLSERSATYAAGYDAVCLFVNDDASERAIKTLSLMGVKMIAMRCAGFDRVDLKAARAYRMTVARVPAYSPYAVAEMAVALLMSVNRKIHKASNRVKMANFTLDAGLMGMDIYGKTVAVMGTGRIGCILAKIMLGFGANVICFDVYQNQELMDMGATYVTQDEIYEKSDVIFLMMPLMPATHHTINEEVLVKLKRGVILINTSRGGLVDTKALLKGLQLGIIGGVGMDVYEHEEAYFFQDWSARHIMDPDLVSLLGNTNVILTAHQAFFTQEAVSKIVSTTLENIHDFQQGLEGPLHPNSCLGPPPKK